MSQESIDLCYWMKRMCDQSLTSISGGNISIKDKESNYWLTPTVFYLSNWMVD